MEPCEERTSTGAAQVPVLHGGVPPDPGPMEPLLQGAGALPVLPCARCPHRKGPGDPSRYRLAFPPSGQEQRDTAGPGCSPLSQASFWRRSWVTTETGSKTEALQSLKEKKKRNQLYTPGLSTCAGRPTGGGGLSDSTTGYPVTKAPSHRRWCEPGACGGQAEERGCWVPAFQHTTWLLKHYMDCCACAEDADSRRGPLGWSSGFL